MIQRMDKQLFLKLYAKYYNVLQRMADVPMTEELTYKTASINETETVSIHRSMKKCNLKGKMISLLYTIVFEYFCTEIDKNRCLRERRTGTTQDYELEDLETALYANEKLARIYLRQFMKNPTPTIALFNCKDTPEEETIFTSLALMWYKLCKSSTEQQSSV